MTRRTLFASAKTGGRDTWQTPEEVLTCVRCVGPIGLDPCTTIYNPTKAMVWMHNNSHVTRARWNELWGHCPNAIDLRDGLTQDWSLYQDKGLVYVNYPFSESKAWFDKCQKEAAKGCEIILLTPARTDTAVWHKAQPIAVAFWRGRITYNDPETGKPKQYTNKKTGRVSNAPAPFPTALMYWGGRVQYFAAAFRDYAKIVFWKHSEELAYIFRPQYV
jgi:hypothetical protein